ncbi:MAG: hypothetical protein AAB340_03395 [Patescibacteria group bacterium]
MAEETLTKKDIQELLAEQTTVILDAVDEKIKNLDLKFTEKLDKLITILDGFLKRMTDIEDEFAMMRHDINRMKKVIKEKLGVELS